MSKECRLTKWVDRMLFGPVYRFVYWPLEVGKRRHWLLKLALLPIQFAWFVLWLFPLVFPLMMVAIAGIAWDMFED